MLSVECAVETRASRRFTGAVTIMKAPWFGKGKGKDQILRQTDIDGRRLKCIVFDFDGTLARLRLDFGVMKERLGSLASQYLPEVPEPDRPVLEWLAYLDQRVRERQGAGADGFRSRAVLMIREMELEAARQGELFPFTRVLLRSLEQKAIATAVITRNCEAAVRIVFPDLEDYCRCFLAREHVQRVKPDPDHLWRALVHLGAEAGSCLMVGDHPLDVETGKRAGTFTAGVASGSGSWDDLARSGADWVASDCETLFLELEGQGLL